MPDVHAVEADRASSAARVLSDFAGMQAGDWLTNARAIAVIPGVKKAAFGFGVRWGKGLVTKRDANGRWLPPSYIEITGGNFGFQWGVQSTDLVLIFTDEQAVDSLLRGHLTLNGDAEAALGPWGRFAQAGVPILLKSGIYTFSRNKGVFAGVSLDGATINIDDSSNANVYGKYINGDEILMAQRVEMNPTVAPFNNALELFAPGVIIATRTTN